MILDTTSTRRISRRKLLLGGACLAASPMNALAEHSCRSNQFGMQLCTATMPSGALQVIYAQQSQSQWCWAACIQMLFRSYGYEVSQQRIVQETFGQLVNMPAGSGAVISKQINRPWQDDKGKKFRSYLEAAYDFDFGVYSVDNGYIIKKLTNNEPLIYGNKSHAMLLVQMTYAQSPMGPNVVGAGVLDPWPGNGARALQQAELVQVRFGGDYRYLSAVRVEAM